MAKLKLYGKKALKAKRVAATPKGPIWYSARRGLMVSMTAQTPSCADGKVVAAKSIVQAVQAAIADKLDGDIYWPLNQAIYLLDRASEQLVVEAAAMQS